MNKFLTGFFCFALVLCCFGFIVQNGDTESNEVQNIIKSDHIMGTFGAAVSTLGATDLSWANTDVDAQILARFFVKNSGTYNIIADMFTESVVTNASAQTLLSFGSDVTSHVANVVSSAPWNYTIGPTSGVMQKITWTGTVSLAANTFYFLKHKKQQDDGNGYSHFATYYLVRQ